MFRGSVFQKQCFSGLLYFVEYSANKVYCKWLSLTFLKRLKNTSLSEFLQNWSLFCLEIVNFNNVAALLISCQGIRETKIYKKLLAVSIKWTCTEIIDSHTEWVQFWLATAKWKLLQIIFQLVGISNKQLIRPNLKNCLFVVTRPWVCR